MIKRLADTWQKTLPRGTQFPGEIFYMFVLLTPGVLLPINEKGIGTLI